MSRKLESKFVEKAMKHIRAIPGSEWERIEQVSNLGTPDLFGCIRSLCVVIEFKSSDKKKPTPLQQDRLDMFSKVGAFTYCVNPENFEAVLKTLYEFSRTREKVNTPSC